jgi:hypothetical protein
MAQQGKKMRVGANEGFAYHSVKLVSLANCNRLRLIPILYFKVVKPFIHLEYCPVPTLTFLALLLLLSAGRTRNNWSNSLTQGRKKKAEDSF